MRQSILVATKNQGKVREFSDMMGDLQIDWVGLKDLGITLEVVESGATFLENARLKATQYGSMAGLLTLADDSGLEVDALGGAPGVYTARYGGEGLTATERLLLLLENMEQVPDAERTARFRCVIVLADGHGRVLAETEGVCEGLITRAPAGDGGFGYDPIFYLPAYGQTMAQLPAAQKHQVSHRGQAVRRLVPYLKNFIPPVK